MMMLFPRSTLSVYFIAGYTTNPTSEFRTSGIQANQWNDITVIASGNYIKLYVNDIFTKQLLNNNRPQVDEVDLCAGDKQYVPADVIIRDFNFAP